MSDLADAEQGPKIMLRQLAVSRTGAVGDWSVEWRVENRGGNPLTLLAARLPHGQFKAEEIRFASPLELAPGERNSFQVSVHCHEPSGLVTENGFVIFQAIWSGEPWRIFARIRVAVSDDGRPETETESITTQKVGFSGVSA